MVAEHKVNFVVVDSVGSACGAETEGKSEFILGMFSALRSLRVTTLLIDHTNKEGQLYGSIYKFNQSRCVWEVRRQHELDTDHIHIGLIHRKLNTGKLLRPLGFDLTFSEQSVKVNTYDAKSIDDVVARMTLSVQIRTALSRGELSLAEITERLATLPRTGKAPTSATIYTTMSRNTKLFCQNETGTKWRLLVNPNVLL